MNSFVYKRYKLRDSAWRVHQPITALGLNSQVDLNQVLVHRQGYFVAPRGAGECAPRGRVCIGRKCRLAADTARDIFVGPRVGVGVSALGMGKITTTTTTTRTGAVV